mmetsp:Transcript_32966/g.44639  ORF Transcript_32966/g.44639 Transcript_32966/m.44639 type:complete len:96 (-) Transcript_32966:358-645(-)
MLSQTQLGYSTSLRFHCGISNTKLITSQSKKIGGRRHLDAKATACRIDRPNTIGISQFLGYYTSKDHKKGCQGLDIFHDISAPPLSPSFPRHHKV